MKEITLKIIMIVSFLLLAYFGYQTKGVEGMIVGIFMLTVPLYIVYLNRNRLLKIYDGISIMLERYPLKPYR